MLLFFDMDADMKTQKKNSFFQPWAFLWPVSVSLEAEDIV